MIFEPSSTPVTANVLFLRMIHPFVHCNSLLRQPSEVTLVAAKRQVWVVSSFDVTLQHGFPAERRGALVTNDPGAGAAVTTLLVEGYRSAVIVHEVRTVLALFTLVLSLLRVVQHLM